MTHSTRRRRLRISITVDFDSVSGLLGTSHSPENNLADYSAAVFAAHAGVGRLLKVFQKHGIAQDVTWFIPGHSMESFPKSTERIVKSGGEIGLHGYSHESAYALTEEQERDVLESCIELATALCHGKRPVGNRAPLYQIRESTINLLQEHGFLYDSSLNSHDAIPYLLPTPYSGIKFVIADYTKPASTWMKPTQLPAEPTRGSEEAAQSLVEIPGSWYTEDATPLCFYPHLDNSHAYVAVDVVEKMWMDRFDWIWENECWIDGLDDDDNSDFTPNAKGFGAFFPIILHPEQHKNGKILKRMNYESLS